jgi:phosphate/sulfate permease
MVLLLAILFGLFLAYANGANDNFKGVPRSMAAAPPDKKALPWASITTFAGSLMALALTQQLLSIFSGKGLVPDSIVMLRSFSLAVAFAAATTVMVATRIGIPISTWMSMRLLLTSAAQSRLPTGMMESCTRARLENSFGVSYWLSGQHIELNCGTE